MSKYLLIQPDEDGNPITVLDAEETKDINQFKKDYGIEKFLDDWPEETDPNYWNEGEALLLEARVVKVKPVKIIEGWELE